MLTRKPERGCKEMKFHPRNDAWLRYMGMGAYLLLPFQTHFAFFFSAVRTQAETLADMS
jgi:hypothetical protein